MQFALVILLGAPCVCVLLATTWLSKKGFCCTGLCLWKLGTQSRGRSAGSVCLLIVNLFINNCFSEGVQWGNVHRNHSVHDGRWM